jgi:hypothetical protein
VMFAILSSPSNRAGVERRHTEYGTRSRLFKRNGLQRAPDGQLRRLPEISKLMIYLNF